MDLSKLDFNEEGYLKDHAQWTPELAEIIAEEEGIQLSDEHWKVIEYLQEQHKNEVPLTIRRVGKS